MVGKTISHYKIVEKLGEGGMGVVYKAQDTKLRRTVALKFLPSQISESREEKSRFIHEAQAASALSHPNVTTIYGIEESSEGDFIVMEYVEGRTLKEIVEKETLSIKEVLDIGIQVCEALTVAHEKGVVHRDIKSGNIMLTSRGQVKIMDFGLAIQKGIERITQTPSTVGTVAYMSPEQASGEEVDRRSDIFSFGVVLYELLTGRLPFGGEHLAAIIYSILNEEPQPVARFNNQVSKKLEELVFKALEKDREERYQHIDDLMADLKHERRLLDTTRAIPGVLVPKVKKKRFSVVIPAMIILALLLAFVILRPFQIQIGQQRKAIAEENSLAIMYFENVVDPDDKDRVAQMITSLLITDLSESQYMRVMSRQRLYDILKLMGKEDLKVIDKSVASEIAERARVKWILTGSILQTEPNIILTSAISEAATGKVIATQRVTGEAEEDLFSVVDKLSVQTKQDLSLPERAKREPDREVAEVTTHSPEAYRHYLEGVDYLRMVYNAEAMESFNKALELDSTFAMAYYRLSQFVEASYQKKMIAKAVKYSNKVSQKEKHYIRSQEAVLSGNNAQAIKELQKIVERYPEEKAAFFQLGGSYWALGKLEEAIHYYKKAIEVDPLYKIAYNVLAYLYDEIGDFEKSIWAINKYISMAPDEANPYDSRADLYGYNGKIDKAIESYKDAVEKKSDFYVSWAKLGHMYLFKGEYSKAESCYEELAASREKETRSEGRTYLAFVPLYQGRFQEALAILDHGLVADRMEQAKGVHNANKYVIKAIIYREKNDLNSALVEAEKALEIRRKAPPAAQLLWRDFYVQFLAENQDFEKAEEAARALKRDIEEMDQSQMYQYWYALGSIKLARGNLEASIIDFEKAVQDVPSFFRHYTLAQAYLEAGRLGDAVAELERMLLRYDEHRAASTILTAKAHYLLGLGYERSGWTDKAVEQYETFLDIWKDADKGIEAIEDAKVRIEKLRMKAS